MNMGTDESLNVAVYKSIQKLKDMANDESGDPQRLVDDNTEKYMKTPGKFDIICIIGPISMRSVAFSFVDILHRFRGETSRTRNMNKLARQHSIQFTFNLNRYIKSRG